MKPLSSGALFMLRLTLIQISDADPTTMTRPTLDFSPTTDVESTQLMFPALSGIRIPVTEFTTPFLPAALDLRGSLRTDTPDSEVQETTAKTTAYL
jgi:hypothetical protein